MLDQERLGGGSQSGYVPPGRRSITGGDAVALPKAEVPQAAKQAILPAVKTLIARNAEQTRAITAPMDKAFTGLDSRVPGASHRAREYKETLMTKAVFNAGATPTMAKVKDEFGKLWAADHKRADEIGQLGYEKKFHESRGWARFQEELNMVEAAARKRGIDPEKIREWDRMMPVGQSLVSEMKKAEEMIKSNPKSEEAKRDLEQLRATERFQQLLAGTTVGYYHALFGGSMSAGELNLGQLVIDNQSSLNKIKNFSKMRQEEAGREQMGFFGAGDEGPKLILEGRYGSNNAVKPAVRSTRKQ